MAPSLKISAGPSVDALKTVAVNHDDQPTEINTDLFQGRIAVRIKNFTGSDPDGVEHRKDTPYFDAGHGKGQSWSMQIQGRFKEPVNADDLVFGNEFDKPIKDHLPYGTSLALQFVKIVDPNLEQDLYAERPYAWSPYLATMPRISSVPAKSESDSFDDWPDFPTHPEYVHDDISSLIPEELAEKEKNTVANFKGIDKAHEYRQRFLGNRAHRKEITVGPDQIVTADFFNGFIDFNDLTLHIPFSGGLKFDLKKYWDGQAVRYYCRDRKTNKNFFVIEFNIVDLHT
ncbi:Protein of unknown function DUF1769 [Kalmanozyma brasiliensis GHG001]|uniref:Domain of unknown function at the cortex 1 domain-containing protein n=1 Tax=Kalmanozyma brasiliensis (strain GHG001) TaxID=1365824 RepID=V5EIV0_KALBG|nr:Protein of unknown function DUF1769 [Kalmanozyma brasiliensis GHG001]EST04615.1 Protein of unknown function DUF1769 [Kalmanozyma brasiliensis GHG001]